VKHCNYCDREVQPKKDVNWFLLILLSVITGGSWLFIYAIYYFAFKSPSCPICGGKNFN